MNGPLDGIPLWALFGGTTALVLLSIEAGTWLGRYRRMRAEDEREALVGSIAAATLTLLGLLLAFTFGLAASRFDARRQIVVQEANAIGTTWLRAGLLPDDRARPIRELLAQYVDSRLEVAETGDFETALRRADAMHRALWAETEALGRRHSQSIVVGLFIQSLNETIDIHATRVLVAIQGRLPGVLWGALYLMSVLTMAGVGYFGGLTRSRRSPAILVLALTFSAILLLIADLDRPQAGLLEVSQQALQDVRKMMDQGALRPAADRGSAAAPRRAEPSDSLMRSGRLSHELPASALSLLGPYARMHDMLAGPPRASEAGLGVGRHGWEAKTNPQDDRLGSQPGNVAACFTHVAIRASSSSSLS